MLCVCACVRLNFLLQHTFLLGLRDLILKLQWSSSKLTEYLMQFFDTYENRKYRCQIKHIEFCWNANDFRCTEKLLLKSSDEELATEVAWVVVYLSALSNFATGVLVKSDVLLLLVERLATSNSLQLLIPVTYEMSYAFAICHWFMLVFFSTTWYCCFDGTVVSKWLMIQNESKLMKIKVK